MKNENFKTIIFFLAMSFASSAFAVIDSAKDLKDGSLVCKQWAGGTKVKSVVKIQGLKNGLPTDKEGDWFATSKTLKLSVNKEETWHELSEDQYSVNLSSENQVINLNFSIKSDSNAAVTIDQRLLKEFKVVIWHNGVNLQIGSSFRPDEDQCDGTIGGDIGDYFRMAP